ncbi:MAG: hypothetical protein R2744_06940 [Bacteroidales bacterium]
MLNKAVIIRALGMLLFIEAIFMLSAGAVALFHGGPDTGAIVLSSAITFVAGLIGLIVGVNHPELREKRRAHDRNAFVDNLFNIREPSFHPERGNSVSHRRLLLKQCRASPPRERRY